MVCFSGTAPTSSTFNKCRREVVVAKIADKERKYKLLKEKYRSHYRVYDGSGFQTYSWLWCIQQ